MTINEAVKLSIKENKCITRNGNLFPVYILPTDTGVRACYFKR